MDHNKALIVPYGERLMHVGIEYGARKRLSLTVYPHGKILAKVPLGLPVRKAESFIRKRAAWMDKHLRHFEQHPPEPPKRYAEDELHPFLGKHYRLRLRRSPSSSVQRGKDHLEVALRDPGDPAAVEKVLRKWYREEALRYMKPRFRELSSSLSFLGLPAHSLRFYRMKRRWGSCSARGVITLNTRLVQQAPASIDYVIIHELCHLRVPAHNREFYALLESVLPDWKTRRRELNEKSY